MCNEWQQDIDGARAESYAEGYKAGYAGSEQETKTETVKVMQQEGLSPELVTKNTGIL